jgi:translation elongation factor EF-Tu-like GTPase
MSQQTMNESNNTTIEINDLEVSEAAEIKGGPKKIFIGGLSAADNDTTPQTREHILLARQVGVPG